MKKLVVISKCIECPFYDYIYPDWNRTCWKKELIVENHDTIPKWCPLESTDLNVTE